MNGYVYKISPSQFALAAFKGLRLTHSAQKDAVAIVEKVCAVNGWIPKSETIENNCLAFKKEDGIEIARVLQVPAINQRKHPA